MAPASSTMEPTEPNPQRRPLFNRPTWSKPQVTSNAADFFSRSDQTYASVIADEERRRKKRLARKATERAAPGDDRDSGVKRRRLSIESDSDNDDSQQSSDGDTKAIPDEGSSIIQVGADVRSQARSASPPKLVVSPKSLTERYENAIAAARLQSERASHSNIVDLEDDEDSDVATGQQQQTKVTATETRKPTIYDDLELSDEEFPELARQAREKARRKRLQADFPADPSPDPPVPQANSTQSIRSQSNRSPSPPINVPEKVISILITSRITNTNPLIVNRKLHQRLKDVRMAWCQRQGFTAEYTATILLVWRGRRLFDVTSCKSLGIDVDFNGNMIARGEKDILGEENHHLHMEAMTEEMFEQHKKEREASQQIVPERPDVEEAVVQIPQEPQVRIILKGKGFEDFKLIVKHVRSHRDLLAETNSC